MCVCVCGGVHLTTLESCWRLGCSRVSPPGSRGRPRGMSGPSAFAAEVPGPRGPRGPVRRALRGSELLVRAAGSRLRSPCTPLAAGRGASSAAALGERGESRVYPLPRSPPPLPPAWAAPRRSGCAYPGHRPDETLLLLRLPLAGRASPQSPTGHPSPPPGAGDRLAFGPREVAAFRPSEPPALRRLPLRPGRAAACGHLVGDPAVLTREGRIPRVVVFAPPPSWAPPGERSRGRRGAHFPLAALHLGDSPRFDDRQLLQGTTSRCRASRFGGGCLLWSRSWQGVCVLEWRGGG